VKTELISQVLGGTAGAVHCPEGFEIRIVGVRYFVTPVADGWSQVAYGQQGNGVFFSTCPSGIGVQQVCHAIGNGQMTMHDPAGAAIVQTAALPDIWFPWDVSLSITGQAANTVTVSYERRKI